MKEFTYLVNDPNGMHARPAGRLATYAKQFDSQVRVRYGEHEADAKRLLSLMSLGVPSGGELHFLIAGEDEEAASASLERYCKEQWGEGSAV